MKLAVNYSDPTADLLCAGAIQIDTFKCPAWPDVVATAQELHPTYVHFPLNAGAGIGDAIDGETKQHADWRSVEALRDLTDTPYVNLHLAFGATDYPSISLETRDPNLIEALRERAVRDVSAVVERFGGELVIVENIPPSNPDWEFFGWAVKQIHAGFWGEPWVITFEYGGVGKPYATMTDTDVLTEQIRRLYALINN